MKTWLSPLSLLGFLALMFLITECHDWTHLLTAALVCGRLGSKGFESWTLATGCTPSKAGLLLIGLSGPFLNYVLMWTGRYWMRDKNNDATKSRGFLLLAASLPGNRILAALRGGGDETDTMRKLWAGTALEHHHLPAFLGLLIVLILTVLPVITAFRLLQPGYSRWIRFAAWMILPGLINEWTIKLLNYGLDSPLGTHHLTAGIPTLVAAWILVCCLLTVIFRKHLDHVLYA